MNVEPRVSHRFYEFDLDDGDSPRVFQVLTKKLPYLVDGISIRLRLILQMVKSPRAANVCIGALDNPQGWSRRYRPRQAFRGSFEVIGGS